MRTIIPGLNKCKATSNLLLGKNSYHLIIHGGTNDISTQQQLQQIAKSIVQLALSLKSNSCNVTLSDITVKNNGPQHKVIETNRH